MVLPVLPFLVVSRRKRRSTSTLMNLVGPRRTVGPGVAVRRRSLIKRPAPQAGVAEARARSLAAKLRENEDSGSVSEPRAFQPDAGPPG